jgi:hypothetical protein
MSTNIQRLLYRNVSHGAGDILVSKGTLDELRCRIRRRSENLLAMAYTVRRETKTALEEWLAHAEDMHTAVY